MEIISFSMLWILTFLIAFIGVLILINNPRKRSHQYFFGMAIALAVWMASNYYENELWLGKEFNIWAIKTDFAFAAFLAYFFFVFALRFPSDYLKKVWRMDLALLIPTLIFFITSYSDLVIRDIGFQNSQIGFGFGPLYIPYAITIFGFFGAGIGYLIYKLIRYRGIERVQVLYVLVGCGIAFINGGIINLFLQNIIPVEYFRMGIYGVFFIVAFTAYAIVKHHLLDIKVIATESLAFVILMVLLVQTLFSVSWAEFIFRMLFFAAVCVPMFFLIRSVIKEVDHRKEVQRLAGDLGRANKKLLKLDHAKTEFISIASHQLRTPLAGMKGYLSMILEGDLGKLNKNLKEYLTRVYQENEHMVQLIETMLNISRIESGHMQFEFKKTDIDRFVRQIVKQFEARLKQKGMSLEIKTLSKLPKDIMIDSDKFHEVVVNLIDNAIKYSENGTITIFLDDYPNHVQICVQDEGIGIAQSDFEDIFMKFQRGDNTKGKGPGGSGLGLYICKKMVEAHGGEIWAESEGAGKGSKFCVRLPKNPKKVLKEIEM